MWNRIVQSSLDPYLDILSSPYSLSEHYTIIIRTSHFKSKKNFRLSSLLPILCRGLRLDSFMNPVISLKRAGWIGGFAYMIGIVGGLKGMI